MRKLGIVLLLCITQGGELFAAKQPPYIGVGSVTRAPMGWVEFCVEYPQECATGPSQPVDVILTEETWNQLVLANALVNRAIIPITDLEHWGVAERWNLPDDGYGDCEDYVLLKRRTLMLAGWPRSALLVTRVIDKAGDGHAVLTVKTDRGEFILDNMRSEVVPWYRTGYRFVKRQSQWDPNVWVQLSDSATSTIGR